jgi:hypothetical protein
LAFENVAAWEKNQEVRYQVVCYNSHVRNSVCSVTRRQGDLILELYPEPFLAKPKGGVSSLWPNHPKKIVAMDVSYLAQNVTAFSFRVAYALRPEDQFSMNTTLHGACDEWIDHALFVEPPCAPKDEQRGPRNYRIVFKLKFPCLVYVMRKN